MKIGLFWKKTNSEDTFPLKKYAKNPQFFVVAAEGGKIFQFWLILTGKNKKNVKKVIFMPKR